MDNEERIRQRAYELWYLAGCPRDRGGKHWARAWEEIEGASIKSPDVEIERRTEAGERKPWWNGAWWKRPKGTGERHPG